MRYFVTGGTGFIGTHLVEILVNDGHEVVVLTRDLTKAEHLPEPVEIIEGDITDKESMRDAMDGVDGVFHLAAWFQVGPGPWNAEKAERINVDGTRNVLELMDELDVPKGVYVSTVGVYGNTGGEYVTESYRSPNTFRSVYQRTKWQAHYEVAEPMIDDGLPLVIVSLGAIFGPGDKDYGGTPRTGFTGYLKQELPMIPNDFVLPFDYVEDTAANIKRAMDEGELGEEYIIASEPRNFVDVFDLAERLTGIPAPRAVPGTVFQLMSYGVAGLESFTRPPEGFESELLGFFATGGVLVDNSKAKRELGIDHRPFEESLQRYLEWEIEQQGLEPKITEEIA
ncbi:NAD-dependent dehydratase [Halorubrum sp. Ib24]|uniref:NAD-dependent epimerase/dehydratase family protein n=1 Tax=unclassified Halorubrum TaxID=2642239 RepID=UPI000B98489C|nr:MULTISPECIES: NAD-dependent epimerase/dehydratase family protein [unclassified Halorubrum]OYR41324.1 NAD-dependent dehydratase [Halorubrum sp. Ib24]OYR55028.1 NAD-dependent dehydratase [Halorubrum sp. Ea1]